MAAALELSGITKSFGGFRALDAAGIVAERGLVHALLGENGAGKSSLMNIAAGLYAPDAGTMSVNGQACSLSGPRDAAALGIGMIHQHFKLVKNFSVVENLLLANPRGRFRTARSVIAGEIRRTGQQLGFDIDPDRRVGSLSIAEQQRVEILKALIGGARILILDEPTAVLTEAEAERLLQTVRDIARTGAAVVLVTHKLRDVKAFADVVTVMRQGRTVATVDPSTATVESLTALAVGGGVATPTRNPRNPGEPRLIVHDLASSRQTPGMRLNGVSFEVRAGQIYGVAGVGGNGQSELVDALCGARLADGGAIQISGAAPASARTITHCSPRERLAAGFAFIPADRQSHALAMSLPVSDNYAVGAIAEGRFGSWASVSGQAIRKAAAAAVAAADVQGVRSLSQRAALLSGGNAQKLVLAREFDRSPSIIVTHSPSRGLDAKASTAVQARLLDARNKGAAVLLISEDLDEVLGIADRIGVMAGGRIVAEFEAPADRQAVGQAMVHHV